MPAAGATSPRSASADDPTFDAPRPIPPRYWWLKRLALLGAVALLSLVGLWFWWWWLASSRLEAAIAAIRARGEPVRAEDLALPPIPDEENAAFYLMKAFNFPSLTTREWNVLDECWSGLEAACAFEPELSPVLAKYSSTFQFAREARSCTQTAWPPAPSPLMNFSLRVPSDAPWLVRSLTAQAFLAAVGNRPHDAVEFLRDAIAAADSQDTGQYFSFSHLSQNYSIARVCAAVEECGPDLLSLAERPARTHLDAPIRESLVGLSRQLADDRRAHRSLERSLQSDQCLTLDTFFGSGPAGFGGGVLGIPRGGQPLQVKSSVLDALLRPAAELDLVHMLGEAAKYISAAKSEAWLDAKVALLRDQNDFDDPEPVLYLNPPRAALSRPLVLQASQPVSIWPGPTLRAFTLHFHAVAMRRMAAVAVAVWLYVADHGEWPQRLDQLVPEYIPAIPEDPFAADGRPISYVADEIEPRLYSVGSDLVDDGGRYGVDMLTGEYSRECGDIVFQLLRPREQAIAEAESRAAPAWKPDIPLTTQPAEGEEGADGQE